MTIDQPEFRVPKKYSLVSWLVVATMVIVLLFVFYAGYLLLPTYHLYQSMKQPYTVVNENNRVFPGETVWFEYQACRAYKGPISVEVFLAPEAGASNKLINPASSGCNSGKFPYMMPDSTPPGEYELVTLVSAKINALRTIREEYRSAVFEVVAPIHVSIEASLPTPTQSGLPRSAAHSFVPLSPESDRVQLVHEVAYCPGDVIDIEVIAAIQRIPVTMITSMTLWDVTKGETVRGSEVVESDIFTAFQDSYTKQRSYQIRDVPEGRYEVRVSVQGVNSYDKILSIPITVPQGCEE